MSHGLRGRVVTSGSGRPQIVAADVRVELAGRPAFETRTRGPFVLELDSGHRVGVIAEEATLAIDATTRRGTWAELAATDLGALARELGAGPHVEATLVARVVRVGDYVDVQGTPAADGASDYRHATSLRATRIGCVRASAPSRRAPTFGALLAAAGAVLCGLWGLATGLGGLLVAGTPVEVAMRGATVTAMLVLALDLWRRGRGHLHLLPGAARRAWLPQLRARGETGRVVVTDASERSGLVVAILALNGPLTGICISTPNTVLSDWSAEAGLALFLPPLVSFVLVGILSWPSARDRRDERLASAMLRAVTAGGPWTAVTGGLGPNANIRRRVDGWATKSGTRYAVVRTVVQEHIEAPGAIEVVTPSGPVEVELAEAVFASTRCRRLSRDELQPQDGRSFAVEWEGTAGMRVLAVGATERSRIVSRGPESVAVLVTDEADPVLVLRRGLVALRAPRVLLAAGLLITSVATIAYAL